MLDVAKMKALREKAGLTMTKAAERANFKNAQGQPQRQRWYDLESGRRLDPSSETLQAIALALNCSMEELMTPAPSALTR
jgi:transcriptional regulator with XRE-family HTH domain